jgi:predicted RNA-binding Zn-ribbon protein involved in translation (DUF1610 family)
MSNEPHLIFKCRKCGHVLYVDKTKMDKIQSMLDYDCPECGEEGDHTWLLSGCGDYDKEYGK